MFVNTSQFSPVIIDGITGAHPKSLEYREWWLEQKRRCIDGYDVGGVHITGDHYWYLNFWKIKGVNPKTKRKDLIAPRFIDMDAEFFSALEEARRLEKNMCIVKRRQVGFSEKLSSLIGKEFSLYSNSQSIIVAGEDRYSLATMRMTMRGLNSLKDTEFYKRKTPDTTDYIQAKYKIIEDGIPSWKGSMSEIYQMTAKNNAQVTVGKCFGKGTKVLMSDGRIKFIENIKKGDLVMGPDSKPRKVLSLHSGIDNLYIVNQHAGDDYVVNSKHDLLFEHTPLVRKDGNKKGGKFIQNNFNDKDVRNEGGNLIIQTDKFYAKSTTFKKYCYRKQSKVDYKEKSISLDPYLIGLWLGDGDSDAARITNIDKEVLDYLYTSYSHSIGVKKGTDARRVYLRGILPILKSYNLIHNKHIPIDYLINSRANRLKLLAGLIDSDGHLFESGCGYEICSKFDRLKDDIVTIARSLGFWCTVNAKTVYGKNYWRINIFGNVTELPVLIQRKKCIKIAKVNTTKRVSVSRCGTGEYYGFECDGDHTFLLSDFTVVHNSPSMIMFEEAGKFPGIKEAYKYIQPALEANFKKTGIAIMVGTGGDMEKGADELEEIFYSPDAWDMLSFKQEGDEEQEVLKKTCYFVPAWKFAVIDEDGNSLKEPSLEQIYKKREESRKAKDGKAYINYLTQMPLVPDEAFMRTGGNRFNVQKLNERLAFIRKHRELDDIIQNGRLEWVKDEKGKAIDVEWIPDANGPFKILEHPIKDANSNVIMNLYKGSTDSYDKDESNSSGSKLSCQIFKGFVNTNDTSRIFVARYTERPKTAEEAYEATAKLCMYYMAPNLIEWSNIGIFGWYERNGFSHFLRERPRIAYANVKDSRVNNRFGIDPSTKEYWITAYRDYIETNVDSMCDQQQIIAAINYRDDKDYNCDITISSSLCIVHELDDRQLKIKEKSTEKQEFFFYKTGKDGKMGTNFLKIAS